MNRFETARALLSGKEIPSQLWRLKERYTHLTSYFKDFKEPCTPEELPALEQLLLDLEVRKEQEKRAPVRASLESLETLLQQERTTIISSFFKNDPSSRRPYQRLYDLLLGKEHFTYDARFTEMEEELLQQARVSSYEELDDLRRTVHRLETSRYLRKKAEQQQDFAKRREALLGKLKKRLKEEEENLRRPYTVQKSVQPAHTLPYTPPPPKKKRGRHLFTAAAVAGGLALLLATHLPHSSVQKRLTKVTSSVREEREAASPLARRSFLPRHHSGTSHSSTSQEWSERKRRTIPSVSPFIEKLYEQRRLPSGEVSLADPNGYHLLVDGHSYTAYLIHRRTIVESFPVSTGIGGFSNRRGSYGTPTGLHRVAKVYGIYGKKDVVFRGRVPERKSDGSLVFAHDRPHLRLDERRITSRILWLEGLDPGVNDLTRSRYIYIHGTNGEAMLGRPASKGCIAVADNVIISLVDSKKLRKGSRVYIIQP